MLTNHRVVFILLILQARFFQETRLNVIDASFDHSTWVDIPMSFEIVFLLPVSGYIGKVIKFEKDVRAEE